MTRKHFIAIAAMLAQELRDSDNKGEAEVVARVTRNLAHELSNVNPAFQFHTFYTAVGLGPDGHLPVFG
jgi:hypothetical protein